MKPLSPPSAPTAAERAPLTGRAKEPLSALEAAALARTMAALADPIRIQLVSLVAARGAMCSCDLEEPLAKSQPTISHHTKILARAGILVGEKRGRWTWWRVDDDAVHRLREALDGGGDGSESPEGSC